MKKILCTILMVAGLLGTASAQVFDESALAAAKAAGASAAGGGMDTLQIGADGKPILGPDGKPVTQPNSDDAMKGGLRMFQDMTGIKGIEQASSPAHASRTGLAHINMEQNFTFNCRVGRPGAVYSAGSLGFQFKGCVMGGNNGATVQQAQFAVCDAPTRAGACATAQDFTQDVRLPVDRYTQFNGLELGLGCNSVGECQVTTRGAYTAGGNDENLRSGAQTVSQQSNLIGDLRKMVTEQDYAGKMEEIGRPLADCAALNRDNPNGNAVGCDGETVVEIKSPVNTCSTVRECLREAVSVQTFERTCQRTFPLTERQTKLAYDSTLTCHIEVFSDGKTPSTNSCVTTDNPDPTQGFTKVGETEAICAPNESTCLSKKHTEYWVDESAVRELGVAELPSAVGGACDLRPGSETRFETCDSWFGRTLDTNECTGVFTDDGTGLPAGGGIGFNFNTKAGCGFCVAPTVGVTCYGTNNPSAIEQSNGAQSADSCSSVDLNGCTFKSAAPMTFTSSGGLVASQHEVYTCQVENRQCVQWSATGSDPSCVTQDLAMGTDKLASYQNTSNAAFNEALVAAATLDATAGGMEGSEQAVPKMFTGTDMRCSTPTGGLGTWLSNNCCRTDLERPKEGNIFKDGCSMDEAKLAAARRSSYATFIGEYCSRKFFGKCLRVTQSYCTFEGILPRLVQEQGRMQLASITASSQFDSIERSNISFKYLDTGNGRWSAPVTVNGVQVAAWQWPAYCATNETAYQQLLADPNAPSCPGVVSTFFAACDIPWGCGSLPDDPTEGSLNWSISQTNPLELKTSAISRFAVVNGACSTAVQDCSYEISAWPVGTGGRAVVTRDLSWPLFDASAVATADNPSPEVYQLSNIGDLMFKGFSTGGQAGGALPATIRLDLSRDGGQTWTTFTVATNSASEQRLTNDVVVSGLCDPATNSCNFRAVGTTVVSVKVPFGNQNPRVPECSGFTAGQMAVLDFSKMDLSEWLASVMSKVNSGASQADLVAQAQGQFEQFNALFQDGVVKGTAPVSANFARAVPSEGFGPFGVKLAVGGFWPQVTGDPEQDTDRVLSVEVDWGDCSEKEMLEPLGLGEGSGFRGVHQYLGPMDRSPSTGNLQHSCLASQYGGNLAQNLTHKVELKVRTSKSGMQTRSLQVENAWARYPGGGKNNIGIEIEVEGKPAAAMTPTAPTAPRF